jgi:PelA/Pel-15E family pectate lyase
MSSRGRNLRVPLVAVMVAGALCVAPAIAGWQAASSQAAAPDAALIHDAMKRATTFMVDIVSTEGGYVWSYLPDLSRRWGEIEARPSMIWIQPQGTATMGHLFLDAYHATRDEFYYRAAQRATSAIMRAQRPSGGWNYLHDFAGPKSLQDWYDTIGRNAWRLEEFQHNWNNATFDDAGTAESSRLLLRMYLEKRDNVYKPALDRAIQFVLDSQYPIGAWPQRYPKPTAPFEHHGLPDYTGFYTFNDDVAAENIEFLIQCYQMLGDTRVLEPITRAMTSFLVMQQGAPQPGWALQYTHDLKPSGARTYEPKALATHTTAANLELLMRFYALTGETKFLARIPEAIDWLDRIALPPGVAPAGRTHPTFVELETNRPIYVHRSGSNVVNGRYYADYESANTLGHYSGFRRVDTADLRRKLAAAAAMTTAELRKRSPLLSPSGSVPLPKYVAVDMGAADTAASVIKSLSAEGKWLGPLGYMSRPYKGPGGPTPAAGSFATTHVGDETDTSPFPETTTVGISTATFIRNMSVLIRALPQTTTWSVDNLQRIGGHPIRIIGAPTVVKTDRGPAVEFNGSADGLFIDANPIQDMTAFTIEVEFQPLAGGQEEQRFVHLEEAGTGNRALIELRVAAGDAWALDTYLRFGETGLTLLDRMKSHPANAWHVAALTFDGAHMRQFVNGVQELDGPVAFRRLGPGTTSLGVRQNLVSHFKGRIRQLRVTSRALSGTDLLKRAP